jgi:hypothetical protein
MRRMVMGLVVAGLVISSSGFEAVLAQELGESRAVAHEEPGPAASLGWGMAAVGTNIGYFPAKILYAFGGSLVGLLAWGVTAGNDDIALGILQPALSGTWVVTPEMLRGEQPIMFLGPSYEPRGERLSLSGAPASATGPEVRRRPGGMLVRRDA